LLYREKSLVCHSARSEESLFERGKRKRDSSLRSE
jgi:hypothetical protein